MRPARYFSIIQLSNARAVEAIRKEYQLLTREDEDDDETEEGDREEEKEKRNS